jgi:hypothetical protein
MVRLVAVLERLPVDTKVAVGDWLRQRLDKAGEPIGSWWALGRVGGRVPWHGSAHAVVPKDQVERWLEWILHRDFRKDTHAAFAATLLSRMSGDRQRDIDSALRQRVMDALRIGKAPESWSSMVGECQALNEADEQRIFGEALPPGLKLVD